MDSKTVEDNKELLNKISYTGLQALCIQEFGGVLSYEECSGCGGTFPDSYESSKYFICIEKGDEFRDIFTYERYLKEDLTFVCKLEFYGNQKIMHQENRNDKTYTILGS